MDRKRVLLVGLNAPPSLSDYLVIEVRGLCDPKSHQLLAAAPLYEYEGIVIYPRSYSHFMFGSASKFSELPSELVELKHENNRQDIDNAFDWHVRSNELSAAIAAGTKVIWLATPDKRVTFFRDRSLYLGYVHRTPQQELNSSPLYEKTSAKLSINRSIPTFNEYFEAIKDVSWNLCWESRSEHANLAMTPEGYCLGKELSLEQGMAWLLTPPPSTEAVAKLVQCIARMTRSDIPQVGTERSSAPVPDRSRLKNVFTLALKRCIEATFDQGKWLGLGYLTDSVDLVERHPRLLRSLSWGDPDYGQRIFEVLPRMLGDNMENLAVIERYTGLSTWLRENDPATHAQLYSGTVVDPTSSITPTMVASAEREEVTDIEQPDRADVFISHASEDKSEIGRPLAVELERRGFKVWFDEASLRLGDSLSRSIDQGLAKCRYGVVILSPSFFRKEWPQRELAGLVAREVRGTKVILPVWHCISASEIAEYSPVLADKLGVSTAHGINVVADQIESVLRGR